jgi:lysyl-tRNA synthetase class 2
MEEKTNPMDIRLEKLDQIRKDLGINPYPYNYDRTSFSQDIHDNYDQLNREETEVSLAGRIMALRVMGKASFCTIQDSRGRIQLYVALKNIGEQSYELFGKLDLGDIIGVKGTVRKTKVGETTVYITSLTLLAKSIRPLPVVKEKEGETFDLFSDKELRYRNRHVDLIVTPGVRETFEKRMRIMNHIRTSLQAMNFLEVETPILQPIYGGAAASPFKTHHNALDMTLYMKISPEPYLKRLIVGGFDRVFEMGKCFRNEGIDRNHNPEFTILECYQAYADFTDMMNLTEELISGAALAINGTTRIEIDDITIDLKTPWKRMKMVDALKDLGGVDVLSMDDTTLEKEVSRLGGEIKGEFNRGLAINELFELLVEDKLIQPTIITHHPVETTPLCKPDYDDQRFLQRFELFINGNEFANAYSESNDPVFQRTTLEEQSKRREVDEEAHPMDENFVQAIETGMPPTGGLGIGIDRLVMLLTGQTSIRDVLFFPTMRPES